MKAQSGLWYNGITHGWGSCNPGSIPGSPNEVRDEQANCFACVRNRRPEHPAYSGVRRGRQVCKAKPVADSRQPEKRVKEA